ncbi:unnamed protein product [Closterium sp. NIES-53]
MEASANPDAAVPEESNHPQDTESHQKRVTADSHATDSQQPAPSSRSGGKIFIGGISWETKTEDLIEHFKQYGTIVDAVVMKDRVTGRPRGFGFVTFEDPSACDKVVEDQHVIGGRAVEAKKSVPQNASAGRGPRTKKIFVGGLAGSTTEEEFAAYFSNFGNVVDRQVMMDHNTGRSRGFGFVTFDNEQSVENVLAQGKMHQLGNKQVEVKKAEPRRMDAPGGNDGFGVVRGRRHGVEYSSGGYGIPGSYGDAPMPAYRGDYGYGPAYAGGYGVPYSTMYMGSAGYGPYPGYGDSYGGEGQYQANSPFSGAAGASAYLPNAGLQYAEPSEGYAPPNFPGGYPQMGPGPPTDYTMGGTYVGGAYGSSWRRWSSSSCSLAALATRLQPVCGPLAVPAAREPPLQPVCNPFAARSPPLQPACRPWQPARRPWQPARRPFAACLRRPAAAAAAARATATGGGGSAGSAGSATGAGGAGRATGSAGGAAGAGGAGPTTDRHCLSWPLSRQLQRLEVDSSRHCLSRTTPPLRNFASGFFSEPVQGAATPGASDSAAALGASESAAALGASESAAALGARASPATSPFSADALHTFTLDSGASRCFFLDCTRLTPLAAPVPVSLANPTRGPVIARASTFLPCPAVPSGSLSSLHLPTFSTNLPSNAAIQDVWVDTFIPGGQRVAICTCSRTGRHLTTFTRRPGSSLYTLTTVSAQVAEAGQVAASS